MVENVVAVSVSEAARRLGVSPRTVATLVSQKELPSRKIGRRRVIPVSAIEEFLNRDHSTSRYPQERMSNRKQLAPAQSAETSMPYLSCRVCGRRFPNDKSAWESVLAHLETKHPTEVLPYMQEIAVLLQQEGKS